MGFEHTNFAVRITIVAAAMVACAMGVSDKDRQECAEQLVSLATCLPYVGGNAKSPTADCCSGLKQVLKNDKKCLCVIVKDRNDPQLGLKINGTLALGLPSVCHASANVSQCPALLHLPPNSPDAQVFFQFNKSSTQGAGSPAPSTTDEGNPTSGSGKGQSAQTMSSGSGRMEIVSLSFLLFSWTLPYFTFVHFCSYA